MEGVMSWMGSTVQWVKWGCLVVAAGSLNKAASLMSAVLYLSGVLARQGWEPEVVQVCSLTLFQHNAKPLSMFLVDLP